jgi:DnaK suppressor protein
MPPLAAADLDFLSRQLQTMKRAVLEELREADPAAGLAGPSPDHEVGSFADDAEAHRLGDIHDAELEINRTRLRNIERAQRRVAGGSYGICTDCGQEIPRARLLAEPSAVRCAPCQAALENHRQR